MIEKPEHILSTGLEALMVVPRIQIVDGGEPHILLRQIYQEQCVGTTIVRNTSTCSSSSGR